MNKIPEDLTEFLYWVREQTENFWSINPQNSFNELVCEDWVYGAKWMPLSEKEICEIELKYSINFTDEHRLFLKILHTINRKEKIEYEKSIIEMPFFYNWLTDDEDIKYRLNWPFETILEDVLSGKVWLSSWGNNLISNIEKEKIFKNWYKNAPKLIPLHSHRFLVSDNSLENKPILSVYGSDIIIYGFNLRTYLLNEIYQYLNICSIEYEEYNSYYLKLSDEAQIISDENNKIINEKKISIPFWDEILY